MSTKKIQDPNLKRYLDEHNISFKLFEHPAVFTVAESDKVTTHIPGARTKNLFLKDENKKYYLVCMPGEKRLNLNSLKEKLKLKKLHFAKPEELKEELNLTPGSVSIFGMINSKETKLIIDKDIWDAKEIGSHPNINTATLVFSHEDLEKFCASLSKNPEVIQIE